jgi:hypothetical protein
MSSRWLRIVSILFVVSFLVMPIAAFADHDPNIVHGTVFNDLNQDGVLDSGEAGIENIQIDLWVGEVVSDTTFTDSAGTFEFPGLTVGSYSVSVTNPGNYVNSSANEVSFEVDGTINIPSINFGLVAEEDLGEISGTVYNDENRNRVFDAGEAGLAGAKLLLMDSEGAFLVDFTTEADGAYLFQGLLAGTYSIREEDPDGYYSTTANEVSEPLAAGELLTDVNFGDFMPEPGELGPIDPLISGFFDLPILDIMDLRDIQNMGYGNIAKVYFASRLSGEPVSTILDLLETEGGWGRVWKTVVGFSGLKGYNLGMIVSGRETPNQVQHLLDGCSIVETQEEVQALMATGLNQGSIKKLCNIVMGAGGDFDALMEAVNQRVDKMSWKDIQESVEGTDGTSLESPAEYGPPACKGKNKNDPGC